MATGLNRRRSMIAITQMIGLIGDEETLVGFLLAGVGDEGDMPNKRPNFMITTPETSTEDIEDFAYMLLVRQDIALIFVATDVADRIRPQMRAHCNKMMEIPTKLQPFDPDKDELLQSAKQQLSSDLD